MTNKQLKEELLNYYNKYIETTNPTLNFKSYPINMLIYIANGFGSKLLSKILYKMCIDTDFTAGLPDLVLYKKVKECNYCKELKNDDYDIIKCDCEYIVKLVEVKSHYDHLSSIQILWADYLLKNDCNIEILKVYRENNNTKNNEIEIETKPKKRKLTKESKLNELKEKEKRKYKENIEIIDLTDL